MTSSSSLAAARLPGRAAILGFARSGRALAGALLDRGVEVTIGDSAPETSFENVAPLRARGARFFFGGPGPDFLDRADWLAISPGVPLTAAPVRAAKERRMPVLAEFEVAWRVAENEVRGGSNRWVAVTGTNGKSTTTAWIADMLRRAERPVALAGNIGVPLSAFLSETTPRDFVCELSSFQLDAVEDFSADVAVLTNVTPDHLDRYDSFEQYAAAKERVFAGQGERDAAVVNADDPVAARARTAERVKRVPFSRRGPVSGGAWVEGNALVSAVAGSTREVLPLRALALPGAHNVENALAALCAAGSLGAPDEAIRESLEEFPGLPHRMELILERGGIRWVNDSKGTNVDATKKSLEGYPEGSVILILGGRDKHGDFSALAPFVARVARRVLTIGEAASVIEPYLKSSAEVERRETMDRAVARAAEIARPGDTVLLSPACASFDQYRNFEERGAHFARLVREMAHGA
ncbi:MAG: UDP-N-acetylmuramoyl-L-alanine--D-glutamate ligase [Acidobacteriota bacterium]|nr:UDP-N-acetylmuramoyl-L-alanine--D-glutamate ligase [Acidobacteriota bacterium]